MTYPQYWQSAIAHLATQDLIMAELITTYPNQGLRNYQNPFYTLTRAIVGQQISVKSADAIWERLTILLPSVTPEAYLKLTETELRNCGLSRPKISYIKNIAQAFLEESLTPHTWYDMTDLEITKQLTKIRGIGIWTAQMFLIFHLHRPDILPLKDIGLIKAIQLHYSPTEKLSNPEIITLSQMWQPYRTVATWYLWRSLDPVVVQY